MEWAPDFSDCVHCAKNEEYETLDWNNHAQTRPDMMEIVQESKVMTYDTCLHPFSEIVQE